MSDNPKIKLNVPACEPIINKILRRTPSPSPAPSPTPAHKQLPVQQQTSPKLKPIYSGSATGNPRNKCALKPGHSLMDWIRLGSSGIDLAGTHGQITPVSHSELAKHNKRNDQWIAIRGKVYNVTHYMDFHPGGADELAKGIGQDATKLFDEVHAWVNYEQLLAKCYIGPLVNTATIQIGSMKSNKPTSPKSTNGGIFKSPVFRQPQQPSPSNTTADTATTTTTTTTPLSSSEIIPRFDWIQKTSDLTIIFYTKSLCNPGFSIEAKNEIDIIVRIFIDNVMHLCNFKFANEIVWPCTLIRVSNETGKIEITFKKARAELWTNFGLLDRRKTMDTLDVNYPYNVIDRLQITHDSYAIILRPFDKIVQHFPIGSHVNVMATIAGSNVMRSYTPVSFHFVHNDCLTSSSSLTIPFLIKAYPDGLLSKYITQQPQEQQQEPESVDNSLVLSVPQGNFSLQSIKNHNRIGLLAAGSGITPILSVLNYLLERTNNRIESLVLMFFNKTETDIWCREYFDKLQVKDNRFHIEYILSEATESWPSGQCGRISINHIKQLTDSKSNIYSTYFCICGPNAFNELSMQLLKDANVDVENVHVFRG